MEIDLNLVRVFDTLMELRSVTRSADRLGLTQPAVSHALARLRRALDDPLFVRSAQGLLPTARALEMANGAREGLRLLNQVLSPSQYASPGGGRRFTLAAGPYFCMLLIPAAIERARIAAPTVSFSIIPVSEQLVNTIDRGDVDLAFGTFARAPGRFVVEPLFEDEMVWIAACKDAEAGLPFDAERILARPRVAIAARGPFDAATSTADDDHVTNGYAVPASMLDNATVVYDSQTAIALVASTDMVALVPRRIAERASDSVAIIGPGSGRPLPLSMLWHARHRADPAFEWLRDLIRAAI